MELRWKEGGNLYYKVFTAGGRTRSLHEVYDTNFHMLEESCQAPPLMLFTLLYTGIHQGWNIYQGCGQTLQDIFGPMLLQPTPALIATQKISGAPIYHA